MPVPPPDRQVFVPLRGQFENIGDIMLRRTLLSWLQPLGTVHVYVGAASPGFAEALGLHADDVVYRELRPWLAALGRHARDRTADYVYKPGEIQLSGAGMKEHLGLLPAIALVRARGGSVVRVGVGARGDGRLARLAMRPSIRLSHLTAWRDDVTAGLLGGGVAPDLAFAQGTPDVELREQNPRRRLVISFRGDRPWPSATVITELGRFAAEHRLLPTVVTQVLRDDAFTARLARELDGFEDLGGKVIGWDGDDDRAQEARLRQAYRETAVAVSDRLHVLVAAATEGAVPFGIPDTSGKIERHFRAVGLTGVGHPGDVPATTLAAALEAALTRRDEVLDAVVHARQELHTLRQAVATQIAP